MGRGKRNRKGQFEKEEKIQSTEIKDNELTVWIPYDIHRKMAAAVEAVESEVTGWMEAEYDPEIGLVEITGIAVPEQEASQGDAKVDAKDTFALARKGELQLDKAIVSWHSHPGDVFASGTDETSYALLSGMMPVFVAIVTNRKGDIWCRVFLRIGDWGVARFTPTVFLEEPPVSPDVTEFARLAFERVKQKHGSYRSPVGSTANRYLPRHYMEGDEWIEEYSRAVGNGSSTGGGTSGGGESGKRVLSTTSEPKVVEGFDHQTMSLPELRLANLYPSAWETGSVRWSDGKGSRAYKVQAERHFCSECRTRPQWHVVLWADGRASRLCYDCDVDYKKTFGKEAPELPNLTTPVETKEEPRG